MKKEETEKINYVVDQLLSITQMQMSIIQQLNTLKKEGGKE